MAEADHLFLRPMPNIMNGESQGAALFSYMGEEETLLELGLTSDELGT